MVFDIMTRRTLSAFLLAASLLTGAALIGTAPAGADADKVTICHAAGLDGTTHYVTLTISENAVYGPGGHFNENGTPQAGHEDDYFGPCVEDTTTTTEPEEPTTTTTVPVPEVKPPKPKPGITIGGLDTVKPVPATPDPVEVAPTFNG